MRHILCFGNPLHADDGFGHAVYQRLAALPLPSNLRLFDVGTPGLAALGLFQDCDEVIIVDALAPGGMPGRLCQLMPESISVESVLPGHAIGVGYLLQALAALSEPIPPLRIIAVETAVICAFQPGLSEPVAKAVSHAVTLLMPYFNTDEHQ